MMRGHGTFTVSAPNMPDHLPRQMAVTVSPRALARALVSTGKKRGLQLLEKTVSMK